MRSIDFFNTHPVFRHEEFLAAHTACGRSKHTSNNLLARHLAGGRLVRVRRGLYATVVHGADPDQVVMDPYLIASQVRENAVVAYHAALQFYGKTYTVWRRFHYLTRKSVRRFSFRGLEFVSAPIPSTLRSGPDEDGGVAKVRHAGGQVRVTTLERTLVDVLGAPDKGGGWEEIWRSLGMVEFFDLDAVIDYSLTLGSALTVARVGFFLEQHREALMVEDAHLEKLRVHAPAQPRYLDGTRQAGKFISRWNLVVPEYILNRGWEED